MADFDEYLVREAEFIMCNICRVYRNKTITNVRMHIESKHFPGTFEYSCSMCCRQFNTKLALDRHKKKCEQWSLGQN